MLRCFVYLCFGVLILTVFLQFGVAGISIKQCKNFLKKECKKSLKKGPVCGTDRVTYSDECELITTSCTIAFGHIEKNHKGKCLATSPAPTIAPVATPETLPATTPVTSPAIQPATTLPGHVCDTNPCKNKGLCLPNDWDVWECICHNGFAGARCEIGKPAPPISVTAKTVPADSRTVLVEWVQATSKRSSQPDGYILEQKMNSKAYRRVTSAIYGDVRRYEVNALQPGSVYRFRLIAVNKAGNSRASVSSNNVTLPEMPPLSPAREVSVRAKSATKLRVRWKKPYREDLNGVLLGFQVIYRVADDIKYEEVMDPEVTHLDLMGLKPNTRYMVFVVAFNAAGRSPVGEGMTAKTFKKHLKPRPTTQQLTTKQPTKSPTQQPTTSPVIGCRSTPCQNGGTCISIPSVLIPGLSTCVCKSGFMGKQCRQSDTPACYSTPCLNDGVCVSDGEGGYTCKCAEGFSGINCGVSMPCKSSPCLNNGTCTPDNNGGFTCRCTDYFTGTLCDERVIGPCENRNPCLNGGTCEEVNAKLYRCTCSPNFNGFHCQFSEEYQPSFSSSDDNDVEICLLECGEHGICRGGPFNREMFCECDEGYTGILCEFGPGESSSSSIVTLACLSSPCVFGTCLDEENGSFKCLCATGYTGILCNVEIITESSSSASEPDLGPCVVNPCQNGGDCLVETQGDESVSSAETYRCVCQKGFIGDTCDYTETGPEESSSSSIVTLACLSSPCVFGTCLDEENGSFKCLCTTGYTGILCNMEINSEPCTPNPCLNGGTCIDWKGDEPSFSSDGSSDFLSYHCSCPLGFKGENCEIETTGRSCSVSPDFSSSSSANDPCTKDPCLNGGLCSTLLTTTSDDSSSFDEESFSFEEDYICNCPSGFAGINCETIQTTISTTSQPIPVTSATEPLAEFNPNIYGIKGSFSRQEDGFLVINGFSYYFILKGIIDVYFVAGNENIPTADGDILAYYSKGEFVNNSLDRTFNNEMVIVKEPNYEVTWIAVASPSADIILSVAFFPVDVETFNSEGGSVLDEACDKLCQNGGVCSIGVEEAMCICLPGYDGVNCEIDLNPCNPSPCKNGGVCVVLSEPEPSSKKFKCVCERGFIGERCEE
ncbi:fibropellin-1-like isoform X2 [Anneissia japonica]|uniref:fibropellin-1-like isoform X2 n=1 Tax=Anneissia japonica TaxID=1529436 RepID=UPI0014258F4C|nr:fibropellin-1-like isoform X2 [Anneissia japonica]